MSVLTAFNPFARSQVRLETMPRSLGTREFHPLHLFRPTDGKQGDPRQQSAAPQPQQVRFEFIEGLRGLAAFYVVLHHASANVLSSPDRVAGLPRIAYAGLQLFNYGGFAVSLFIVLSGFCLMLPVTRHPELRVARGWRDFFARRAMRILPPYYAVLALSLLAPVLIPALGRVTHSMWDDTQPNMTAGAVLSHLFLVHNLSDGWIFRINYAMWSIATEWQIYFFFPLLLLAWRRAGAAACVVTGCAIGLAIQFGLHSFGCARPWYVGLFALGMAAAGVTQTPTTAMQRLKSVIYWDVLAATFMTFALIGSVIVKRAMPVDYLVGVSAFCLVVLFCGGRALFGNCRRRMLKVLSCRPIAWLGKVSYSLYLVHPVAVAVALVATRHLSLSPISWTLTMLASSVALSLLATAVFYQSVERHCIPTKRKTSDQSRPGWSRVFTPTTTPRLAA